jgi:hypothetical protein
MSRKRQKLLTLREQMVHLLFYNWVRVVHHFSFLCDVVLLIWWSPVEGLSLIEERNILSYFNSENCLIGKIQSCQKVEFIGIHRRVQMVDLIHIYNRKYSWERYDGCNFSWRSELYEYYLRHCSMVPLYFIYWSVYYYIFHKNVGDTR